MSEQKVLLRIKQFQQSTHGAQTAPASASTDKYALLDLDEEFFAQSSKADGSAKTEAIKTLVKVFCGTIEWPAEDQDREMKNEDGEEYPSMYTNQEQPQEDEKRDGIWERFPRQKQLSKRFIAGVLLHDLLSNSWQRLQLDESLLQVLRTDVVKLELQDYQMRNLQARITAIALELVLINRFDMNAYKAAEGGEEEVTDFEPFFEPICEKISENEFVSIDFGLRVVRILIERFDELSLQRQREKYSRDLHPIVPLLLPALFEAFTSEETGVHGREQILHLFYLLIRLIAWADGIDNELVQDCLGETFQSWMALFLQIIQSNPNQYFNVKKNALKCLTVIFRDLINFSKESINLILKPSWKLLNSHLPVFTEVVAFNQPIPKKDDGAGDGSDEEEGEDKEEERDIGNESFDEGEKYGVEGMTFHLLELLSTLVLRPNVQAVVLQGLVPLITTVSSYLLIQNDQERQYVADQTYFIADNSQDLLRRESIRSQCLVLIFTLIEVFGDTATQAVLLVVQNIFASTSPELQKASINHKADKTALSAPETQAKEETKEEPKSAQEDPADEAQEDDQDEEEKQNQREAEEFKELLNELIYISKHPKNIWKRREVAILIMGVFVEDISRYMTRQPHFNAQEMLFDELLKTDFDIVPKSLKGVLIGRSLWCTNSICDLLRFHEDAGKQYASRVLDFSVQALCEVESTSVQLIATRTLIKYTRKIKNEELLANSTKFERILKPLMVLLDKAPLDCVYLPIEAFATFSKINKSTIAQMSPLVTPKLLVLFRNHHSEGALGSELINLFKLWCNYDECRQIFVDTFIPFIMQIVDAYYRSTPNAENKHQVLSLKDQLAHIEANASHKSSSVQEQITTNASTVQANEPASDALVDASILSHVLDLLCTLLKNTKTEEDREKIVAVFPQLLNYVDRSDDMFLLLNGTTALKTFIHLAHAQVLKVVAPEKIIEVCQKLLSPQTNEQAALCLGNLVIQVIHKIQPRIDTTLVLCVVWKIYKSRMPSIVQSLVLIIARLIQTNPEEIVDFLSKEFVDNRVALKIVLDKWLLQQALFRGSYTRAVTISSLCKMFRSRDQRIEPLMVIGYNPSHSNINSEVNAPFKILSLLLRFLENETKPTKLRPLRKPIEDYDEDQDPTGKSRQAFGGGAFGAYEMKRSADPDSKKTADEQPLGMDSGERMDTMGVDDSYGSDEDHHNRYDLAEEDKLSVNLDDIVDDEEDEDDIDLQKSKADDANENKDLEESKEQVAVDEEDRPGSQGSGSGSGSDSGQTKSTGSSGGSGENLFAVVESKDKGLADIETGSEVYLSELLAGFDMEDFDDAEEANEEDLIELGDDFAKIDIVNYVKETLNSMIADDDKGCHYVYYCAKQLPAEDIELAKKFLKFPKEVPALEPNSQAH